MTATSYVTLDNDDLGANKIFRAATASALDTNPVSIAQRGTGAPWLNGVGAIEVITTGSGNWTVPAGVYRIRAECTGGGGGGADSSSGGNGSASTFGSLTGSGGAGGTRDGGGGLLNSAGGDATGGTINFSGGNSVGGTPGHSRNGRGSMESGGGAAQYGGGGFPNGAAGGTAVKVISVEPGDLIAYSIGSGGAAGTGTATAGAGGIIIIEY